MNKFAALSDSTRTGIIELLGAGERMAGDIGARFPISAPAVSQHLKALREAGLVRVRIDGQRRIYSLDPAGFDEMEQWFARVRGFWGGRLDALERALEQDDIEGETK
jgi:DNA-binding transcriptional ArsR family regulator